MTPRDALACLKEIRGLERVQAFITAMQAPAPEWRYVLTAIDWQLRYCRYALSQADPILVASVEALLAAESSPATQPVSSKSDESRLPHYLDSELPKDSRIH